MQIYSNKINLKTKRKRSNLIRCSVRIFVCKIGEHRCPIKDKNQKLEDQMSRKDIEIHSLTEQLEQLKDRVEGDAKESLGDKEFKKILTDIKQSPILSEKNELIRELKVKITEFEKVVEELKSKNTELQAHIDTISTDYFNANSKEQQKYIEYKKRLRQIGFISSQIAMQEKSLQKLNLSISEKVEYEKALCDRINELVDSSSTLEQHVAKLRVQAHKKEKVKPTVIEKTDFWSKLKSIFTLKWLKRTSKVQN
jgi:chromosome segregation ATPase